jgi:hypothetical protein
MKQPLSLPSAVTTASGKIGGWDHNACLENAQRVLLAWLNLKEKGTNEKEKESQNSPAKTCQVRNCKIIRPSRAIIVNPSQPGARHDEPTHTQEKATTKSKVKKGSIEDVKRTISRI